MTEWRLPEGLYPFAGTIKVSVATVGSGNYHCPARLAMKARGLRPINAGRRKPEPLEDFTLGPFMATLDEAEQLSRGRHANRRPLHDGLRAWTAHAKNIYRQAFPADAGSSLVPVPSSWIVGIDLAGPDHRGAVRYEISAWGRRLASPDGNLRELRLPKINAGRTRTEAEIAIAALVTAEGRPGPLPQHVRVLQIGLTDGKSEPPLFEGDRDAARRLFAKSGKQALADAVDSTEYRPGSACVQCPFIEVCPALPRAPGVLCVEDRTRPRRSWSPTNGRSYRVCPARDHMRRLKLPTEWSIEHSPAADRGRAVHDFLASRHGSASEADCSLDIPLDWVGSEYTLPDDERDLGRRLLRHHMNVCPLRHARAGSVRVEPSLTFHDTASDVVVITEPDLLYRDGDSWVWRETKTRTGRRPRDEDRLDRSPQLALAVMLLAHGALGGSRARSRVELEILRPDGVDLEIMDPFTSRIREIARDVLIQHVRDWHVDDQALPRPTVENCARCEVARWCTVRATAGGVS